MISPYPQVSIWSSLNCCLWIEHGLEANKLKCWIHISMSNSFMAEFCLFFGRNMKDAQENWCSHCGRSMADGDSLKVFLLCRVCTCWSLFILVACFTFTRVMLWHRDCLCFSSVCVTTHAELRLEHLQHCIPFLPLGDWCHSRKRLPSTTFKTRIFKTGKKDDELRPHKCYDEINRWEGAMVWPKAQDPFPQVIYGSDI